jgi:hypothetical protein
MSASARTAGWLASSQRVRTPEEERSFVVTDGFADEVIVVFPAGVPVGVFSVGARAGWRIEAAGVQDVHFYLCFDGSRVFAAPASPSALTWIDGQLLRVGTWTELPPTGEIVFGAARVKLGSAQALPVRAEPSREARSGTGTLRMSRPVDGDTIVGSVWDDMLPRLRRANLAATTIIQPLSALVASGAVVAPTGGPPRPAPEGGHARRPRIDKAHREILRHVGHGPPAGRRGALGLAAMLALVAVVLMAWKPASFRTPKRLQAPAPPASAPASVRGGPEPAPVSAGAALGANDDAGRLSGSDVAPSAATDSLERQAVDYLARGMSAEAASVYERLVQAHPSDPRFREAARLARRQAASHESR